LAGETIFKICEHMAKLQARRLTLSHALCIWKLSCLKIKNLPSILSVAWRNY